MSTKKKILVILLLVLIMASTLTGIIWNLKNYQMIGFRFYPKNAEVLDLREEKISVSQYNKLRRKMPDCRILWQIPLQDKYYPQDMTWLTLPELTAEDAQLLPYFTQLETLDLRNCQDPALAATVQRTYPQLNVLYSVRIGGQEYDQDTKIVTINGIEADEAERIAYLPQLAQVRLESGRDPQNLATLMDICRERNIPVLAVLGMDVYDLNTQDLYTRGLTEQGAQLLTLMPQLKRIHLAEPVLSGQRLMQLVAELPHVEITWEKEVLGTSYAGDISQLDLSAAMSQEGVQVLEKAKTASVQGQRDDVVYQFAVNDRYPMPDLSASTASILAQLEQALDYFPNLEKVIFGGGLLDNEAMAAYRESHREDYKVVWYVQCGNKMVVRTDSTYFMPTKYHVYYFLDDDAQNLTYCEDMICIDLGHMAVSKIDWVASMPELQYLVLAHSQVKYIEPIRSCKKLKFLELDWSPIRDYSPLKDCTALEDLNLGETYADFTPVGEMTWLKNLWMVNCNRGPAYRMTEALKQTHVVVSGSATVAGGWRSLPNYYAMRDHLGMYYMTW